MKNPPKICLISGTFPPIQCGVGDYLAVLVKALIKEAGDDFEFSVLTSEQASTNEPKLQLQSLVQKWDWSNLKRVMNWLGNTRPDIVHYQYPTSLYGRSPAITFLPLLIWLQALWQRRKPPTQFLTIHEYHTFHLLGKIRIWLMALSCQQIIAISPNTIKSLSWLRFLGKSLQSIPLGSNISNTLPPEFSQNAASWRQQHNVPNDKVIIGYFGFVSPSKGLDILLKAFANLPDISDKQLLLIADPTAQHYEAYYEELQGLIAQLDLKDKIQWTGYATEQEVAAYIQSSTLIVLPFIDGVSLRRTSLVAALLNGAAVISTQPINLEEAAGLQSGENIRLVPANDSSALSDAIALLLADSNLRHKLSENGQKFALKLDWAEIARQHLSLYARKTA